jgi:hypothetical protein
MSGAKLKDLSMEQYYCAFMVAIVLCRHRATPENLSKGFTPDELAREANSHLLGSESNFHVDPDALHQGLKIGANGY